MNSKEKRSGVGEREIFFQVMPRCAEEKVFFSRVLN
jgi:hypothetical protein